MLTHYAYTYHFSRNDMYKRKSQRGIKTMF